MDNKLSKCIRLKTFNINKPGRVIEEGALHERDAVQSHPEKSLGDRVGRFSCFLINTSEWPLKVFKISYSLLYIQKYPIRLYFTLDGILSINILQCVHPPI